MKEKIYNKMIEYGWNLGDNNYEDFDKVYELHNKRINKEWEKLEEIVCNGNELTLEQDKELETLQFMTDFLRAIDDLNKDSRVPYEEVMIIDNGMNSQITQDIILLNDKNLIGNENIYELKEQIDFFVEQDKGTENTLPWEKY